MQGAKHCAAFCLQHLKRWSTCISSSLAYQIPLGARRLWRGQGASRRNTRVGSTDVVAERPSCEPGLPPPSLLLCHKLAGLGSYGNTTPFSLSLHSHNMGAVPFPELAELWPGGTKRHTKHSAHLESPGDTAAQVCLVIQPSSFPTPPCLALLPGQNQTGMALARLCHPGHCWETCNAARSPRREEEPPGSEWRCGPPPAGAAAATRPSTDRSVAGAGGEPGEAAGLSPPFPMQPQREEGDAAQEPGLLGHIHGPAPGRTVHRQHQSPPAPRGLLEAHGRQLQVYPQQLERSLLRGGQPAGGSAEAAEPRAQGRFKAPGASCPPCG